MGLAMTEDRWRWPAATPLPPLEILSGPEVAGYVEDWVLQILDGHMVVKGTWKGVLLQDPRDAVLRVTLKHRRMSCFVGEYDGHRLRLQIPL